MGERRVINARLGGKNAQNTRWSVFVLSFCSFGRQGRAGQGRAGHPLDEFIYTGLLINRTRLAPP